MGDYIFSFDLGFKDGSDLSLSSRVLWDMQEGCGAFQKLMPFEYRTKQDDLQEVCLCVTWNLRTMSLYGVSAEEQLEIVNLWESIPQDPSMMSIILNLNAAESALPLRMVGKMFPCCDFDAHGNPAPSLGWGHNVKINWETGQIHLQALLPDEDGDLVCLGSAALERHLAFLFNV